MEKTEDDISMTGSLPPDPRRSSQSEVCLDCEEEFESYWVAPKIGSLGFWTAEAQNGRCLRCHVKYEKARLEHDIDVERREKENRRKREVITILGGIKPYEEFTFQRFDPGRALGVSEAYAAALAFNPDKDNLFFYGKNDLGKTHLATAIAHKFLDMNVPVRFYTMTELIDRVRGFEDNWDAQKVSRFLRKLIEVPVLVLDELGIVGATPYVVQVLWQILNGRINTRRNGLVITSNDSLNDLHMKYGGKIPYRIERLCGETNLFRFGGQK